MNTFRLAALGGAIALLAACGSRPPDAAMAMKAARPGELHTCEGLEAAPGVEPSETLGEEIRAFVEARLGRQLTNW